MGADERPIAAVRAGRYGRAVVLPNDAAPGPGRGAPAVQTPEAPHAPNPGRGPRGQRWIIGWAAAAGLVVLGAIAATAAGATGTPFTNGLVLASLALTATALSVAVRASAGDARRAWGLHLAGVGLIVVALVIDRAAGRSTDPRDVVLAVELVWLAAFLVWIAGIGVRDRAALRGAGGGRIAVDLLVVAIAAAVLLERLVAASPVVAGEPVAINVAHAAVSACGLVAAWLLLQPLILGRDRGRAPRWLHLAFFLAAAAANAAWLTIPDFPDEPVIAAVLLLLGAAAAVSATRGGAAPEPTARPRALASAADLVPFGLTAGMGLALVIREAEADPSPLLLYGTLAAVGLLLIRQGLVLRASRRALKGAEARALTDPVTGLGNARAFSERMRVEAARCERDGVPLALLLIDVDHLKLVNDTAGHPAGDRLLQAVASTVDAVSRAGDVCCRIGGDEFALLAPSTAAGAATALAGRILGGVRGLEPAAVAPELPMRPTVSIGVAVMPQDAATRSALHERADEALYAAKRGGRDRVCTGAQQQAGELEHELERARAALLARESDFRAVFEASVDAMAIIGEDGIVLDVNRAMVELETRPREELIGRSLESLVDPAVEPRVHAERQAIRSGMTPVITSEIDLRLTGSGREVTLEYSAAAFAPDRQLLVLRDVTARRAAEAELRRREEDQRTVLAALPDRLVRLAADGTIRAVLPTSPDFTSRLPAGYRQRVRRGERMSLGDLPIAPEIQAAGLQQIADTMASDRLQTREYVVDWAQERVYYEVRMLPHGDDEVLAVVRDVTGRRTAEQAREAADERYRMVVETANEALVLTDAEDRITFVNQRGAEMFGATADELVGRRARDYVHPDARRAEADRFEAMRSSMQPIRFDLQLLPEGADALWVQASMSPLAGEDGTYAGALAMMMDITERKAAEQRLRDSEERFRGLADASPMLVWTAEVVDDQVAMSFVNAPSLAFTGLELEQLAGWGWLACLHPDERSAVLDEVRAAWTTRMPLEFEHRLRRHDGAYRWMLSTALPRLGDGGELLGYVGSLVDITGRRTMEEHLRASEREFRDLADTAPMLVWTAEAPDGGVTFLNRSWLEFTGMSAEDSYGFGWLAGVHPDDKGGVLGAASAAWAVQDPIEVEYRLLRHDGEYRWISSSGRPRVTADGDFLGYVGSCVDITERRRTEARLAQLAYADELTGLPNRRLLEDRVAACAAGAGREAAAVLYCGVDRFKLINDGLGGEAADGVLRECADRLAAAAPAGALVARHSGDEFVVFIEGVDGADAEPQALAAADQIHAALGGPLLAAGQEILLSITIGVSICPGDARSPAELVPHASRAMAEAKRAAPGRTRLAAAARHPGAAGLSESARLRRAIEHEELVLHYQPIVNIVSAWTQAEAEGAFDLARHVRGAEALVRWQDPSGTLRMPDEFVPLAERTGLIGALGDWVVAEAARQTAEWSRRGLETLIGFNLSPSQLHDPGLVRRVLAAAQPGPLGRGRLVMEMTESVAMADVELSRHVMAELRQAGIEIAVDDFGTGYSTLGRLRDLEVDYLKIDGSFLAGVPGSPIAAGLLRGIVHLAVGAGLRPIAEGIESRAQWRFLVEQGCRRGQGFYFCGPIPAEEMSALLAGAAAGADRAPDA